MNTHPIAIVRWFIARFVPIAGLLLLVSGSSGLPSNAHAAEGQLTGTVRHYHFARTDGGGATGELHSDLTLLRLNHRLRFDGPFSLEAHLELGRLAPPANLGARLATAGATTYFDLDKNLRRTSNEQTDVRLDRLNLRWDLPGGRRLVLGRQAISWGVATYFPAMDLFAAFAPERIDREFKAGVDALRLTLPRGMFGEVEFVAGSLGRALDDDGVLAGLWRFRSGVVDVGLSAGRFHRDVVLGAYGTADIEGTGVHAEVTWTDAEDPLDGARGRGTFWRAALGADRLLRNGLTGSAEVAWNGAGASGPAGFPAVAMTDRFLRGEMSSVGTLQVGMALTWQLTPLVTLSTAALVNPRDPSALFLPYLSWSVAQDREVLAGLSLGVGPSTSPLGLPRSEYGSAPDQLYVAYKAYF